MDPLCSAQFLKRHTITLYGANYLVHCDESRGLKDHREDKQLVHRGMSFIGMATPSCLLFALTRGLKG